MSDEPKFFRKNWIGAPNTNVASSGQATMGRIYDRDTELLWASVGSSDIVVETLRSTFLCGGSAIVRPMDTLIVLNHNLKKFKGQYWNGAAWVDITGAAIVAETNAYTVFSFDSINAYGAGLYMETTRVVDAQKTVGEVWALQTLFTIPTGDGFSGLGITPIPSARALDMFAGGTKVHQMRWTGNRVKRFRARVDFTFLSDSDKASFEAVLDEPQLTAYLEPVAKPQEVYLVTAIPSPYSYGYSGAYKGLGHSLSCELREV